MFKNYIKVALRNISRSKLYSFLNVFGLAIGLTCFMLIYMWVQDELSYDAFHSNSDKLFRVEQEYFVEEFAGQWPMTSGAYGPTLVDHYPEIINYVRFFKREITVKDSKNNAYPFVTYAVDNSIFSVFDFKLIVGKEKSALLEPNSIVLTHGKAIQLFGHDDIVGETVSVEWGWKSEVVEFKITGILEDVPQNSHIHFDMLFSLSTLLIDDKMDRFDGNYLYTYVLLDQHASKEQLQAKFGEYMEKYRKPALRQFIAGEFNINDIVHLKLKNITDIHLNPCLEWEIEPQGDKASVSIIFSIAILIIVIACINFVNLSVARARKRAKEVGLRKTLGAKKGQLWTQFLFESVVITITSAVISILFVQLFLPAFSLLSGKLFTLNTLLNPANLIGIILITILTAFAAGFYPAFYLTSFDPAKVMKGTHEGSKNKLTFRKIMVIVQFVASITLVIGTLIIQDQIDFIQNKSLGFDKENIITIPVNSNVVRNNFEEFKNEVLQQSEILNIATSSNIYGDKAYNDSSFDLDNSNEQYLLTHIRVGYDYLDTYGIEVIAGRKFSREYGSDTLGVMILNESAASKMGKEPEKLIGRKLDGAEIIGVVKDFNFKSLHKHVESLALILNPWALVHLTIKLSKNANLNTIDQIENIWKKVFMGIDFNFRFLDEKIEMLYQNESKLKDILLVFSLFSIVVACLGLFGLSSFIAEEKTKEIGIRKVMGANSKSLVLMLIKDFSIWLLIAIIIAWPISYLILSNWLESFVYRIDLSLTPFVLASILVLTIAILTVSFQSMKAALANPVDSLRDE